MIRVHTVPRRQVEDGFGGGSIWSTAVDTKTGYAFAGTGQPTNPNRVHERINAILKIDLNRRTEAQLRFVRLGEPKAPAIGPSAPPNGGGATPFGPYKWP